MPRGKQNELKAEVTKLGGHVSSTARACTHLVANQVRLIYLTVSFWVDLECQNMLMNKRGSITLN